MLKVGHAACYVFLYGLVFTTRPSSDFVERQESYSPIDELAEPQGNSRGSLPIIKRTVLGILMLSALWLTSGGPSV